MSRTKATENPALEVAGKPATGYALGRLLPGGLRYEFLRREVFPGNLMRTDDPHSAWTWSSLAELQLWVNHLKAGPRAELVELGLSIVPVRLETGPAFRAAIVKGEKAS